MTAAAPQPDPEDRQPRRARPPAPGLGRLTAALEVPARVGAGALYGVVAALGLLTLPAGVLVTLPVLAGAGAAGYALTYRACHPALPGRRRCVWAGLLAGVMPAFSAGLDLLGRPAASWVFLGVLLGCCVAAAGWIVRTSPTPTRTPTPARSGPDAALGPDRLDELLDLLPLDMVIADYQATQRDLTGPASPGRRHQLQQQRDLLLRQMRRRDPGGFTAWTRAAAANPDPPPAPQLFLRDDQDHQP